jgi:hypothetical protein
MQQQMGHICLCSQPKLCCRCNTCALQISYGHEGTRALETREDVQVSATRSACAGDPLHSSIIRGFLRCPLARCASRSRCCNS